MDTVRARRLYGAERDRLHQIKRQLSNQVNSRHARIVLLSRGGQSNRQIAAAVDCSPQWVRQIIHRFNQGGIQAIEWYPYFRVRGGPRKFTADLIEEIAAVALSPPQELIGMNCWSLAKLRDYLVEQKIIASISLSWLREWLRRCRIRLRRTKTWKESTDPQFKAKYRAIRRLYKNPPKDGRVICVDEFGPLNLQPRGGSCLAGPGKSVQRHRATYSRSGGVRHFLAYYDLKADRLYGVFTQRKRWVEFLSFLRWLRRRYPSGLKLYLVLDNYGPHLKTEVHEWAARHNVRFYYTPTNASWLNRIECQFTALKRFALENSDFSSHQEQQEAIQRYLDWPNGGRQISLEHWHSYRRRHRNKRHAA